MCIRDSEMAEPGILGVNAGAGLFIAAFMVFLPQRDVYKRQEYSGGAGQTHRRLGAA